MRLLSSFKGDEAIEVLSELIEPVGEIAADEEVINLRKSKASMLKLGAYILKAHKEAVKTIVKALSEDYREVNALSLPIEFMKLINDPEIKNLFTSASGEAENGSSTGASAPESE